MRTVYSGRRPPAYKPDFRYQAPSDVVNDRTLDTFQKRAILSSWASDLFAVESCPWLREVPGVKQTLRLSDILAALRALDHDDPPPRGGVAMRIAGSPEKREPALRRSMGRPMVQRFLWPTRPAKLPSAGAPAVVSGRPCASLQPGAMVAQLATATARA